MKGLTVIRKMQIIVTMKGLPISHQIGKNQKADHIKYWQEREEVGPLLKLFGGSANWFSFVEGNLVEAILKS